MAADILRPHSAIPGYYTPDGCAQFVDTNVELGDHLLSSGFKEHLSRFYKSASVEDKACCLELLTAIDLGEAAKTLAHRPSSAHPARPSSSLTARPPPGGGLKKQHRRQKRPQTAMAAMTSWEASKPGDAYGPYTTTYNREFWGNQGDSATADRPGSTRAFQTPYNLSGPIGASNYRAEYCMKQVKGTDHVRSGSASGNRRNNPHPTEEFMNWRLPARKLPYSERSLGLTDDIMDQVCRGKLRSTYQYDYLGKQQGAHSEHVTPELPPGPSVQYSLASQMRHSYRHPEQQTILRGNTQRYGCNKHKHLPANGVVPTVSMRQMNLKTRTTYDRDFTESFKPPGTVDVRELGRNYTSNAIAARGTAYGEDPMIVEQMMASLAVDTPSSRPSARLARYPSPNQNTISPWVGPM